MKKEQKIELVRGLSDELKSSKGVILANYKGLSFVQMDAVRRDFKENGCDCRVIKNTLLKKAFDANEINGLGDMLAQPTVCIIVKDDYAAAAKIAKKYTKEPAIAKFFLIKGGYFDGMVLDSTGVQRIADLPSREELLAKALGSMNAPITNFVSVLANIIRGLVNVLNGLKEKKEKE